ncbi:hypothetical protein Rhopal_000082-T1 [Rhodotorula paludigena]|uniref:Uncharacterized protein n=1 Tax=Rhodotorula paludigena TaxID=86838 RepID=A0AAV5GCU3_9BASI|nr:hypothetical protein Rhopal_000082-T1 [Rhodotorula paludigena]
MEYAAAQDDLSARAHIRSLVSRLVPPSSPYLRSLFPAPPARPRSPLALGHDERNIDFWDARRVREWEEERARGDKWEMSREQVDDVKRCRKALADTTRRVREEDQTLGLDARESWSFPPRLHDDSLLSRRRRDAWRADLPVFDPRKSISALVGPKPKHLLPKPDEALLAMDAAPDFDVAFDLKLSATVEQIAEVKQIRQRVLRNSPYLRNLQREDEMAWQDELKLPTPDSPAAPLSPPLFPRKSALPLPAKQIDPSNPFEGFLPSERSDYPSSPRGVGISQAEWDKEDLPIFSRVSQLQEMQADVLNAAKVASLLRSEHTGDVDQLDSDDSPEPLTHEARLTKEGSGVLEAVFASDDTLGERPVHADDLLSSSRLAVPKFASLESALPPAACPPPLSAFLPSSTASEWTLAPLSGLRALTLQLSWQCWTEKAGETLEGVLLGEAEYGGADEAEPEEAEALRSAADALEHARGRVRHEEGEGFLEERDQLALLAASEDEAELQARIRPVDHADSSPADETLSPGQARSPDQGAAAAAEHSTAMANRSSPAAALPAATTPTPSQLAAPSHNEQAPRSDSSDFAFVFPPSSPAVNTQAVEAVSSPATTLQDTVVLSPAKPARPPVSAAACEQRSSSAVHRKEPLPPVEKVNPAVAPFSTTNALDRFLGLRGIATASSRRPEAVSAAPARGVARQPAQGSSPPPNSIPFTTPAFLSGPSLRHSTLHKPFKVVAFDALLQKRAHVSALEQRGFALVHRPSRFAPEPFTTPEPHLIVDARTCVLFLNLASLISNVMRRPASTTGASLKRQEALLDTLHRLVSQRFDRVLVVLEEQQQRVGGVKVYSYTPPVLAALEQLAGALQGSSGVEIALSKGPEHSAELVMQFVEHLAGEREAGGGLPVLDVFEQRTWLTDDPAQDELALLELDDLNELAACAILAVCSANDFLGLSLADRAGVFANLLGSERVARISESLDSRRITSSSSPARFDFTMLDPAAPPPFRSGMSLSQLDEVADERESGLDECAGDEDWMRFVDLSQ